MAAWLRLALAAALAAVGVECLDNGVGLTPPLGWSTWMTCGDAQCTHDACTESEVKEAAAAMAANGMRDLGYEYVNLDDCWASTRNASGALTWDAQRFPSGIDGLALWLHQRGFKLGVYTSAGNVTCSSGGRPYPVPGSRGHYDLDAKTFALWGVDYVKLDWCGDIKKEFLQGHKAHVDFARAMNASGRPMFLEVVAGYYFTGPDEVATVANSWRFCGDHHDTWTSSQEQLLCRADQLGMAGKPGGWPFMDLLMTGGAGCTPFRKGAHCSGQTDDEYRTTFALWSLTQSPLIVATDVRQMTAVMNATLLNRDVIALHQSTATPPGSRLATWPCKGSLGCHVWGRKLPPSTAGGGAEAEAPAASPGWMVALVNLGKEHHSITVTWRDLGLPLSAVADVRDVWAGAALGTAKGSFSTEVPPHGTALVTVVPSGDTDAAQVSA